MANLYDKAGLVNIPVGYQEGFLYNIKPEDNTLGFRFNRDSAATRVNKEGLIEQVGYFGPELVKNGNFSEIGPELIINGDFATDSDWTKGIGWSISGGKANCDGTQTGNTNLNNSSNNGIVNNKFYKIVYTISNYVSGSIRIKAGNTGFGIYHSSNGTYTQYIKAQVTTFPYAQFNADADFIGSIDNVSVKQVDPNNYWNLGTGWGFGDDKATYDGSGYSSMEQSISDLSNKKIKVQFDIVDYTSGTIRILPSDRQDGVDIRFSGNGTYTQFYTSIADKIAFQPQLLVGSITNISVKEVLGDKPRIDYTDSLTSPSFLLEPQSTNLFPYSEDFRTWLSLNNAVVTYNFTTSPDGTKNASKFTFDGTLIGRVEKESPVTNGNEYTFSIWLKNNNLSYPTQVWLGFGTFGQGGYITVTNEWQRFTTTQTANGPNEYPRVQSNEIGSIFAWGAQLEESSYPTSYIPTSGSTVTRAQETCIGAGSASTFNDSEGVLYAEIAALANDGTNRAIAISDGTTSNVVRFYYSVTDNRIVGNVKSSGSTVFSYNNVLTDATDFIKVAVSYKANDFKMYVDGVQVSTDTSGAVPTGLVELAFDNGASADDFYGRTKGIYVFNEALTNDELQQLTGPEYNSFAALAAAYNYTVI